MGGAPPNGKKDAINQEKVISGEYVEYISQKIAVRYQGRVLYITETRHPPIYMIRFRGIL